MKFCLYDNEMALAASSKLFNHKFRNKCEIENIFPFLL